MLGYDADYVHLRLCAPALIGRLDKRCRGVHASVDSELLRRGLTLDRLITSQQLSKLCPQSQL